MLLEAASYSSSVSSALSCFCSFAHLGLSAANTFFSPPQPTYFDSATFSSAVASLPCIWHSLTMRIASMLALNLAFSPLGRSSPRSGMVKFFLTIVDARSSVAFRSSAAGVSLLFTISGAVSAVSSVTLPRPDTPPSRPDTRPSPAGTCTSA